jgi:hypothetical protein
MKIVSIVLGILGFLFLLPGLIPCFGSLNYINLFFSTPGLVIAFYYYINADAAGRDTNTKVAMFLNLVAVVVGIVRLTMGGGIL